MTPAPGRDVALPQEAVSALWRGNVIEAIKFVRVQHNIGLKEAKNQVDAYLRSQPSLKNKMNAAQAEAREGFMRWLVVFLLIGAAAGYWLMQGN